MQKYQRFLENGAASGERKVFFDFVSRSRVNETPELSRMGIFLSEIQKKPEREQSGFFEGLELTPKSSGSDSKEKEFGMTISSFENRFPSFRENFRSSFIKERVGKDQPNDSCLFGGDSMRSRNDDMKRRIKMVEIHPELMRTEEFDFGESANAKRREKAEEENLKRWKAKGAFLKSQSQTSLNLSEKKGSFTFKEELESPIEKKTSQQGNIQKEMNETTKETSKEASNLRIYNSESLDCFQLPKTNLAQLIKQEATTLYQNVWHLFVVEGHHEFKIVSLFIGLFLLPILFSILRFLF